MSERGSWVTSYIYCKETYRALKQYFESIRCSKSFTVVSDPENLKDSILAGKVGGMYPGEEIHKFEYFIIPDIEEIIKEPIRICVLADDGGKIFDVEPDNPSESGIKAGSIGPGDD